LDHPSDGWDASKDALLGRLGTYRNPAGIKAGKLSGASGRFEDAAAALSTTVELAPASEQTIVFLLGQIDYDPGRAMDVQIQPFVEKYAAPAAAEQELQRVKAHWAELTGHSQVQTPDDSFNFLVNTWLKYQAISGHLWARTGYYQQSGAFGFRDQLQTSQVWLTIQPERMLEHIKMNARHQLQSGVVLHWWHPLSDKGLLTDMTDDLLWLPFMLSRYCDETGNLASLDEVAPYYDGGQGTLLEHSLKAIDVVLQRFSPRGLPLIGAGDWCDGFSAVGLDWKGESIWLGMFLFSILKSWAEILQRTNTGQNIAKAAEYLSRAEKLRTAINEYGWNGQWYIAATKDDGEPIGDISNQECKIYLNSQTWSILTGIADPERQEQVKQAMFERLESDNGMLLLAPAYSVPDTFIGYITRYAPGLRENGGVYTHAATWSVMALAHMGLADDAMRIFRKLNPILQAESDIERYMAEPYVLPGNIDGPDSKYYGRAGWSWYTGSAGWLLTIAMDYIAGARAAKEGLMINPCMPRDWPQIKIKRRFRNAVYHIIINNPKQITGKVKTMKLNGQTIAGNIIPTQPPGEYQVEAEITE
jgi:cellobiose phosphorylase